MLPKKVCFLFICVSLLTAVLAQPSLNGPLPYRINPLAISGNGSCPASQNLESALTESVVLSLEMMNPSQVVSECGRGLWTQVLHFDMSNTSQQCLSSGWTETSSPARSCSASTPTACPGAFISTSGLTYSHICGRAIGYASGSPDAFADFDNLRISAINGPYLEGVSVTHGSPRQHAWSFVAGHGGSAFRCPCDNQDRSFAELPPSFVGNNYFCDGDYNGALWDAMECTSNCCTFNNPPWFSVSLPVPTSDDIEVRICSDQLVDDETVQLNFLQLYVQ